MTSKGESLLTIMQELTDLIENARTMPMSASVLVNKAEALALLDAAREVLPAQIAEAEEIVAGAHDLVQRAQEQAASIEQDAQANAKNLVEKENLVKEATIRAEEIIAKAHEDAEKLTAEANDYADRQLAQFESELEQIAKQVRAGRAVIQARIVPDEDAE